MALLPRLAKQIAEFHEGSRQPFKASRVVDPEGWIKREKGLLQGCLWSTIRRACIMAVWHIEKSRKGQRRASL